jgi:hypothetical protein
MRLVVANILAENIKRLNIKYPAVSPETKAMFAEMRDILMKDD